MDFVLQRLTIVRVSDPIVCIGALFGNDVRSRPVEVEFPGATDHDFWEMDPNQVTGGKRFLVNVLVVLCLHHLLSRDDIVTSRFPRKLKSSKCLLNFSTESLGRRKNRIDRMQGFSAEHEIERRELRRVHTGRCVVTVANSLQEKIPVVVSVVDVHAQVFAHSVMILFQEAICLRTVRSREQTLYLEQFAGFCHDFRHQIRSEI